MVCVFVFLNFFLCWYSCYVLTAREPFAGQPLLVCVFLTFLTRRGGAVEQEGEPIGMFYSILLLPRFVLDICLSLHVLCFVF